MWFNIICNRLAQDEGAPSEKAKRSNGGEDKARLKHQSLVRIRLPDAFLLTSDYSRLAFAGN